MGSSHAHLAPMLRRRDVLEGRYHPAVSLYTDLAQKQPASVCCNFGMPPPPPPPPPPPQTHTRIGPHYSFAIRSMCVLTFSLTASARHQAESRPGIVSALGSGQAPKMGLWRVYID